MIQDKIIRCMCGETFPYVGGKSVEIAAKSNGWQHTKKYGWLCPEHAIKPKYNNIKTESDGVEFASAKEARRYQELKLLEAAGEIAKLELQPVFLLQQSFKHNGKTERKIEYVADFRYYEIASKRDVVEDVKGVRTAAYQIKRKLLLFKFNYIDFREIE